MTFIYYFMGNLDIAEIVTFKPADEVPYEMLTYFKDKLIEGVRPETIKQLSPECVLRKHWPVDGEKAFPPRIRFELRKKGVPSPDILRGAACVLVSEKAKSVIERIDPGIHQFFAQALIDANGDEWTDKQYYSMVIGRIVDIPPPKDHLPLTETDWVGGGGDSIKAIDRTPGLAAKVYDFPLWTVMYQQNQFFFNTLMMSAFRDAGLSGLKEINLEDMYQDETYVSVAHIWFRELNN